MMVIATASTPVVISVTVDMSLPSHNSSNSNAAANANHFRIADAIDFECKPVSLGFIDFVKVQVGVNTKSGWLGEVSTEVFGFYDYNMKKQYD